MTGELADEPTPSDDPRGESEKSRGQGDAEQDDESHGEPASADDDWEPV
jgi:hypothetical protein